LVIVGSLELRLPFAASVEGGPPRRSTKT